MGILLLDSTLQEPYLLEFRILEAEECRAQRGQGMPDLWVVCSLQTQVLPWKNQFFARSGVQRTPYIVDSLPVASWACCFDSLFKESLLRAGMQRLIRLPNFVMLFRTILDVSFFKVGLPKW